MAINYWSTHLLASYAKKTHLGETLTFGRQNILIPARYHKKLSKAHNIDSSTLSGFCEPLLYKIGSSKVISVDVSDHEGCDLILDLSQPIPEKYYNLFDTIIDYGTSEHIFNYPQVLSNVFRMLKNDGAYNFCLPVTGWCDHGLYQFSPNMFTSISTSGYFNLKYLFMLSKYSRNVYAVKNPRWLRTIELLSYKRILAWGILIKNKEAILNENCIIDNIFQINYLKEWQEAQIETTENIKRHTENAQELLNLMDTGSLYKTLKKHMPEKIQQMIPEKIKQMIYFHKAYDSISFNEVNKKFNSYKM